jgi:hypothetical protein
MGAGFNPKGEKIMFASSLNLSNPKLPLLKARLKNTVDLALIKVVAHRQNPSQNPLPSDPKSLERAFSDVFNAIPRRKQDDAMTRFQSLLSQSERARVYGDLGQVNFASSTSVVDQVKALPLPAALRFTQIDVDDLEQQIKAKRAVSTAVHNIGNHVKAAVGQAVAVQAVAGRGIGGRAAVQQAVLASEVKFEVVSAECIKPNDILKDEINLAVGTVDGLGAPLNAGPFFVGEFKKDDVIDLGAAAEFTFKIDQTVFPASFPAFAFMVERDVIHNTELAGKLALALTVTAAAILSTALTICILGAAGVVTAPAAVVAVVAMAIAGLALTAAGTTVLPLLADDISFANGDSLVLEAAPAIGSVFERNVTISGFGTHGRGEYNLVLRWSAI